MKASPTHDLGRPRVVSRVPEILRLCRGRRVLHLGCADSPYTLERGEDLLHKRLAAVTSPENLVGVELDPNGARLLAEMGFDNILVGDLASVRDRVADRTFDVVLAGEIIEHVDNVGSFLESIAAVMDAQTELVLTTVNAMAFKTWVQGLAGREKVHPEHWYYFSHRTIVRVLADCGFECRELYYYQDVVGDGFPGLVDRGIRALTALFPAWSDGLIAVARLRGEG